MSFSEDLFSDELSDFAYGLEQDVERLVEKLGSEEEAEEATETDLEPLSPAALEKTIGSDGLRQLHSWISTGEEDEGIVNHILNYFEMREGVSFFPGKEDNDFDEARVEREKIDPRKPFGYYDGDLNPRVDEPQPEEEEAGEPPQIEAA